MDTSRQAVDLSALKWNQISIIALLVVAFVFNQPFLASFVALVLILGTLNSHLALFKQAYLHVARPLKLLAPHPVDGSPTPHEFAQLVGGIVTATGSLLLFTGAHLVGWSLVWLVIVLAAANLSFGFCAGCFLYFHLGKLGIPGFRPEAGEGKVS